MVDRDLTAIKLGTLVKLIDGGKLWEYSGVRHGKIHLHLPDSNLTLLVNEGDVDWKTIQEK
jgi:hypothetical protein